MAGATRHVYYGRRGCLQGEFTRIPRGGGCEGHSCRNLRVGRTPDNRSWNLSTAAFRLLANHCDHRASDSELSVGNPERTEPGDLIEGAPTCFFASDDSQATLESERCQAGAQPPFVALAVE